MRDRIRQLVSLTWSERSDNFDLKVGEYSPSMLNVTMVFNFFVRVDNARERMEHPPSWCTSPMGSFLVYFLSAFPTDLFERSKNLPGCRKYCCSTAEGGAG